MLDWFRRKSTTTTETPEGFGEVDAHTDVRELMRGPLVVFFKHSTACPVSWVAHSQMKRFHQQNPAVPVYMVPVIQQRKASDRIAEITGIRHESPQVIVLREGKVVHSGSHGAITDKRLSEWIAG
jgi:bacillithiol system protein YtxJ